MITVKRLTLEDAVVLLAAAEAKARAIGVTETICVCDDGGHPIALHRMTGARITGVERPGPGSAPFRRSYSIVTSSSWRMFPAAARTILSG